MKQILGAGRNGGKTAQKINYLITIDSLPKSYLFLSKTGSLPDF